MINLSSTLKKKKKTFQKMASRTQFSHASLQSSSLQYKKWIKFKTVHSMFEGKNPRKDSKNSLKYSKAFEMSINNWIF